MADIYDTGDVYSPDDAGQGARAGADGPPATSLGGMVRFVGAMASLALMVGVGIWGYKLVVRDVSGVPVVRALEGPMRLQPDDPGGSQADHQGLAVNAVAADGSAAPTADRLMLAPGPVDLAVEDTASGQTAAAAAPGAQQPDGAEDQGLVSMSVEALVAQLTGKKTPNAAASDPRDINDVKPEALIADDADAAVADAARSDETVPEPAVVTGPGVTRSPRPQARPGRHVVSDGNTGDTVLNSAIAQAVDTLARLEVDPASLAIGTRLAQLGAYESAEIARAEWDKLTVTFGDYFNEKQRVIQKASSGGRTFYRLRALGFEDLSAARRFCSALVAENADCIPVTTR